MNEPVASNPPSVRFRPAATPYAGNEKTYAATGSQRTLARGLAYARLGWPVFPCQPGSKEPATRHGFRDATTDPAQIRSWWQHHPDANLAIATGAPGPDVLDVDHHGPSGNGYATLIRLKHADLLNAAGTVVKTPHGGLHAYFTGSSQASGRLPRHHLDFKSAGGYVLAPPSQVDGRPYSLLREDTASGGLSWAAVIRLLDPQPGKSARSALIPAGDVANLSAWVERLEQGNRNAGLFWAACRVVESGQEGCLDELAAAAARTGLSDREISRTIASAIRGTGRRGDRQAEREATT